MKKKKSKQVRYLVIITDSSSYGTGPRSVHSFRDEYGAKEFFDKIKFALDILNDDWYYVTLEKVES